VKILVMGNKGKMGSLWEKTLKNLGHDVQGYDLADSPGRPLLLDRWYDGAVVATPTSEHYPNAAMLLRSAEKIMIEKPITANVAQAESLMRMADGAGVQLSVGYIERFNPAWQAAVPWFQNAETLDITRVVTPNGKDYGGPAIDLATHDIDLLLWLFGPDGVEIKKVYETDTFVDYDFTTRFNTKGSLIAGYSSAFVARGWYTEGYTEAMADLSEHTLMLDGVLQPDRIIAVDKMEAQAEHWLYAKHSSCATGEDGLRALEVATK
jgi:predicted dehydrogenase